MSIKTHWQNKVLDLLKDGKSVKYACASSGITTGTYYNRLKDNPEFKEEAEKAKAHGEHVYDKIIYQIATDKHAPPKVRLDACKYIKAIQYDTVVPQHSLVEISGNKDKPLIIGAMSDLRKAMYDDE